MQFTRLSVSMVMVAAIATGMHAQNTSQLSENGW